MRAFANWLARSVNPGDGTVSLRHIAYGFVILASIGWLTYELVCGGGMKEAWSANFYALLAAVTTGKIVGAKQAQTPTEPGAPNEVRE